MTLFYFVGLKVLGTCEVFEEKQVGNERYNIFSGCPSGRTATIVLRGGADQVPVLLTQAIEYITLCLNYSDFDILLLSFSLLKKQSVACTMQS